MGENKPYNMDYFVDDWHFAKWKTKLLYAYSRAGEERLVSTKRERKIGPPQIDISNEACALLPSLLSCPITGNL